MSTHFLKGWKKIDKTDNTPYLSYRKFDVLINFKEFTLPSDREYYAASRVQTIPHSALTHTKWQLQHCRIYVQYTELLSQNAPKKLYKGHYSTPPHPHHHPKKPPKGGSFRKTETSDFFAQKYGCLCLKVRHFMPKKSDVSVFPERRFSIPPPYPLSRKRMPMPTNRNKKKYARTASTNPCIPQKGLKKKKRVSGIAGNTPLYQ